MMRHGAVKGGIGHSDRANLMSARSSSIPYRRIEPPLLNLGALDRGGAEGSKSLQRRPRALAVRCRTNMFARDIEACRSQT